MRRKKGEVIDIGVLIPALPLYFWRQAAQGIKQAVSELEASAGIGINADIMHYSRQSNGYCAPQIFDICREKNYAAWIIFPVCLDECRDFIEGLSCPVVLLNDMRSYISPDLPEDGSEPFGKNKNMVYVGADGYREGELAFELIRPVSDKINSVYVVNTSNNRNADSVVTSIRINTFTKEYLHANPRGSVRVVDTEFFSKTCSAFLARKLIEMTDNSSADCVYIGTGATYQICEAVRKLKARFPDIYKDTFCIGHELAPSDIKNLSSRLQRGFVMQDIFEISREAVCSLVWHLVSGEALTSRLFEPSVFTCEQYAVKKEKDS